MENIFSPAQIIVDKLLSYVCKGLQLREITEDIMLRFVIGSKLLLV